MVEQATKDEVMVSEILYVAKKLFSQYGLKKTTMEDIANATGKSTLYYYFSGKIEIFEAVVDEELKTLLRMIRQTVNMATTAINNLETYVRARAAAMEKFHNLSAAVYENLSSGITDIPELREKYDQTQITFVKEIITESVQSGEFKALAEKI